MALQEPKLAERLLYSMSLPKTTNEPRTVFRAFRIWHMLRGWDFSGRLISYWVKCALVLFLWILPSDAVYAQSSGVPGSNVMVVLTGSGTVAASFAYSGSSRVDYVTNQISVNLQFHPYTPQANGFFYSSTAADFSGWISITTVATETAPGTITTDNLAASNNYYEPDYAMATGFFGPQFSLQDGTSLSGVLSSLGVSLPTSSSPDPIPYQLFYNGTNGMLTVWISLPSPFAGDSGSWAIPCTATVISNGSTIQGLVEDASTGKALPGASALVNGQTFISDANGMFSVPLTPPGPLTIQITKPGYQIYNVSHILPPFSAIQVTFQLNPAVNYWDPGAKNAAPGSGGTGTWDNTTGDWWEGGAIDEPWSAGDNAVFAGTSGTVTLGAAVSASSLTFNTSGYAITGSSILSLLGAPPTVTVSTGSATIACPVAGTGGLSYSGPGTLILIGNNTYSGGTVVNSGTLQTSSTGTLGSIAGSLEMMGGTLDLGTTSQTVGAVDLYSGTIQNGNLNCMSISKTGSGGLSLTNAILFTGTSIIQAGTVSLNENSALSSSSGISILTGGTLAMDDTSVIGQTTGISLGSGGTFDVSANDDYTWPKSILSASGIGLGSFAAVIKGSSQGTVNLQSQSISLGYFPTTFDGDSLHPSLYISDGVLSFTGVTDFQLNIQAANQLGPGTYVLIQQAGGSIMSAGSYSLIYNPNAIEAGLWASIGVSGGDVNLNVIQPPQPPKLQTINIGNSSAFQFSLSTPTPVMVQPQSSPTLNPANWVDAGPSLMSTPPTTTVSVSIIPNTQQFYRVMLLP